MFTDQADPSIAALGEAELLRRIRQWLPPQTSPYGLEDDCAVFTGDALNLGTVDSLIYGRHFDEKATAAQAGKKLVNRNLSDIAAMGGTPAHGLLALFLPPNLELAWLESFYAGMRAAAEVFGLQLSGGDIAQVDPGNFAASLTLLGYAAKPVPRRGVQVGDAVLVTGRLGGSILGRHLDFTPRIAEGQWLAAQGVRTMMDISDGLAKDLPAMLAPDTSARLDLAKVPISDEAHTLAQQDGREALEHALTDGEDYELLLTHPEPDALQKEWAEAFPGLPLTCIGFIDIKQEGDAPLIDQATGKALPWGKGYEHLSG